MANFIHRWAELVINKRFRVIIISILLMGVAIIPMKNLYYDNSNELFFLEDDPNLKLYNEFLDRFVDSESISVGIEARQGEDSVFTPDTLRMIKTITEFLEDHEHVNKVSSLANYQYIHSKDDTLETTDLVENWDALDDRPELMRKMKQIMEGETLVHGSLVSEDMKHTVVFARTVYIKGGAEHKVEVTHAVMNLIAENNWEQQGYKIHLFGIPVLSERFETLAKKDQSWVLLAMLGIVVFVLAFSFRSFGGTLVPFVVIITTVLYVTGLQGLLTWPYNTVLTALPFIIIIVGIGDSVHLIVEYYHFRYQGQEPQDSAKSAIKVLWMPCFFTSITTAAGFMALSVTRLVPIRQFGLLGATASFLAFLVSLTILPALLSYVRLKPERVKNTMEQGLIARFTGGLASFTFKYKFLLSALCLILVLGSVFLARKIEIDTNYASYFKENSTLRQDINYFDRVYKGAMMLDFMVDSGEPGGIKNPVILNDIARLQAYLDTLESAGKAVSYADFVKKMNQAMHNDDPAYFRIPDSREAVAQYLLLYENSGPENDLSDLKTSDERYARIYAPLSNMSSMNMHRLMSQIRQDLKTSFPDLNVQLTGNMVLYVAHDFYIQEGVVKSFGLALLIIGLCFFVIFRSFKYGVLALIPSIFPVIFTGAIMYLLGISLNLGTMIIGAMTIGIAVDDSIHVMNRYLSAFRDGKPLRERIHLALTESGRAVIFSSIVLVLGFSVMLLGSFTPFIYTGLISAAVMVMALLGDLFFLPAILFVLDGRNDR
ncbi:MAG: MMPL family transporter [Proteobacteria bacterium]|nr:MMPL family transporter [Pseudomonadota bacterium]